MQMTRIQVSFIVCLQNSSSILTRILLTASQFMDSFACEQSLWGLNWLPWEL